MPGVRELVDEVRLEVLLGDGTRLVVLVDPLGRGAPTDVTGPGAVPADQAATGRPGRDRERIRLTVRNDSRRRSGCLALPVRSGQPAARVRSGGRRRLPPRPAGGLFAPLGAGRDAGRRPRPVSAARATERVSRLSPAERLARYGPSTGDQIRLGDTRPLDPRRRGSPGARRRADLGLREEHAASDDPVGPGRARRSSTSVVIGAVVVDPMIGVVKADIGIKDGRIVGVGRAGNTAISDGIDLEIGPHTQPIPATA